MIGVSLSEPGPHNRESGAGISACQWLLVSEYGMSDYVREL